MAAWWWSEFWLYALGVALAGGAITIGWYVDRLRDERLDHRWNATMYPYEGRERWWLVGAILLGGPSLAVLLAATAILIKGPFPT